jgi:hypothetical protein
MLFNKEPLGRIMARPKASREQHIAAYLMYINGDGPKAIYADLFQEWRESAPRIGGVTPQQKIVSERTISTWLNAFKSLAATMLILDSPFQWHHMESYSIPWEASAYLTEILFNKMPSNNSPARITFPDSTPPQMILDSTSFTGRIAQWCWRVHLVAPEIGTTVGQQSDVYHIAKQFAHRQMTADVLREQVDLKDLETILVYKPWLNDKRHQAYHQALYGEIVPPILGDSGHDRDSLSLPERFMDAILDPILRPANRNRIEHPELLLSQQLKYSS